MAVHGDSDLTSYDLDWVSVLRQLEELPAHYSMSTMHCR